MEIKEVYIGSRKIRPTTPIYPLESIVTRQKATNAWAISIPNWDSNWKISVDDIVVSNWWWETLFSWYISQSEHIVKIEPITLSYWRAKRYIWQWKNTSTLLIEIIQDKSYIWFADSATNTWTWFRKNEYNGCSNLMNTAEEYLPDTVTNIWNNFRQYQYYQCYGITEVSEEVLPDSITYIWTYFRDSQYYWWTSITNIKWWKDTLYGNTGYRNYQFYNCTSQKTVKVLSDVWYASNGTTTLPQSYVLEIQVPTAYLSNFVNSNDYPRSSITDSKFVWY